MVKIAPSILSADFGRLNEEIASVESYSDYIHVDVMDGHFVPNITIGPAVVSFLKTGLPLDVHLMIENPEKYVSDFVGALKKARGNNGEISEDIITVHAEATSDLRGLIENIKSHGVKAGVSIKPGTGISAVKDVLDLVDLVLVMTVEPGFGGQKFMENMMPKIVELKKIKRELIVEVDGGINSETARVAVTAGTDILVAGSYIFGAQDRKMAIESLRA